MSLILPQRGRLSLGAPLEIVDVVTQSSGAQVSSHSITLPSYAADDRVFICHSTRHTATHSISGWTKDFEVTSSGGGCTLVVFSKVMTGTEGSTVTMTRTSSGEVAAVSFSVRNLDTYALSAAAQGSNSLPDSANLDMTTSAERLWFSIAGQRNGFKTGTVYPSGFTLHQDRINDGEGTGGSGTAIAAKLETASQVDPGAYTGTTSDDWVAVTLGLEA